MKQLFVIPAYGRRYDDKAILLADWNDGKDFKILNGPYISIREVPQFCEVWAVSWHFNTNKGKKIKLPGGF